MEDSVTERIKLHAAQSNLPKKDQRQDMFHFLCEARDPDTGLPAYSDAELRAEANLLIIAGSDTTAISLSGLFFYLTGDPRCLEKLTWEVRSAFTSAEEIVHGPRLMTLPYLRACIDEGMRLTPSGPCDLPREVLPGGLVVLGEHYPAGTTVGTTPWADARNNEVYGDGEVFRPERWIVDEAAGVSKEDITRIRANFHPFAAGPGNCVGQNFAMVEMMITVARLVHRLDIRRAPGSTKGGGSPELGWGRHDSSKYQVVDAYISILEGPEVQFRRRVDGNSARD